MQSNFVNAMQLTRSLMEFPMPKASQELNNGNDTFMNILNERMDSRNNNAFEKDIMKKTEFASPDNTSLKATENNTKLNNEPLKNDKLQNDVSNNTNATTKSDSVEDNKAVKTREPKEAVKVEDMTKAEKEEEIKNLEAMIALLEQLLAQLEAKIVAQVDPVFTKQALLPAEEEGVSPMDLLSMLVSQNIEKLKDLMGKIEQNEQSPEITALLEKIAKILEELNGQYSNSLNGLSIEVASQGKDLLEQMKAEVSQLIEELKGQVSEIRESLVLKTDTNIDLELNSETQDDSIISDDLLVTENADSKQEEVEIDNNKADSQTEYKGSEAEGSSHVKQDENVKGPAIQQNDFKNFIIPDSQTTKAPIQEAANVIKSHLPLSQKPLEQTVTNQLMMKIKLMAGENKQEVEMHLKPESLGKLSLKIIHERGEVLAKITAENQQVKEILESNMQMLKDALENSGLTVQNLSVSVGNNNDSGKENAGESLGRQNKGVVGSNSNGTSMVDKDEIRTKIENEYNTSQINLTA